MFNVSDLEHMEHVSRVLGETASAPSCELTISYHATLSHEIRFAVHLAHARRRARRTTTTTTTNKVR